MQPFAMGLTDSGLETDAVQASDRLFAFLDGVARQFNGDPSLNTQLYWKQGAIAAAIEIAWRDPVSGDESIGVEVNDGRITVTHGAEGIADKIRAIVNFRSTETIGRFLDAELEDSYRMMTSAEVWIEGNPAHLACFSYLMSLVDENSMIQNLRQQQVENRAKTLSDAANAWKPDREMRRQRMSRRLRADPTDPGVDWLDDPYLSDVSISDFPRLEAFKAAYHATKPEVTSEQGLLLTEFYLKHGYERKPDGSSWNPALRSAEGFRHLMTHRQALLRDNDLLAGTVTPNPVCGSITTPFTVGWSIWGDLKVLDCRGLEEYAISDETIEQLHKEVFPFWMNRHMLQVWKEKVEPAYPDMLVPRLNDRLFLVIPWSLVSLNPGSPGFADVVQVGLKGLRRRIDDKLAELDADHTADPAVLQEQRDTLNAMRITLDGIAIYTRNLAEQVLRQIDDERGRQVPDEQRIAELETLHRILERVPENPAETLHEAIQSIWLMFIGVALETMDDTITLGRLDQVLQPFFEADIEKARVSERAAYIKHALELIGCLYFRITSHRIAVDTIRTWQNSGSPGTASITLGGVTRDGKDAVNDMTYLFLKVTDMLCLDDPDMDARYMRDVNSMTFLKRVCEVAYLTSGTPSIHNDEALIKAITRSGKEGWKIEDARDWVSVGCIEPVITGKHYASTGDIDFNLTVPLIMALNNGRHPMWNINDSVPPLGPVTGDVADFETFDDFFAAFTEQCEYLCERLIVQGSHLILKAQQEVMPAPLYSALLDGCIESGKGMTHGGARYNSSGTSCIALSEVVDSLLVIKQLVFDRAGRTTFNCDNSPGGATQRPGGGSARHDAVDFQTVKAAVDHNFGLPCEEDDSVVDVDKADCYRKVYALARYQVAKFGSGDPSAREMAARVIQMIADIFHHRDNGRGGVYTTGYRSNNNHTVFGRVTDALPCSRLKYRPFTSGLTPAPTTTKNLLDNLIDVGSLDPCLCDNSYTLNVRLAFSKKNTHEQNIDRITWYVRSYCDLGGMLIQFNMVDTDTLRDAMAHPEEYPDLIARVAGYTGYYTKMNRDLQLEILGRTEFEL